MQGRQGNVQENVMHEQSVLFGLLNLLLFDAAIAVAVAVVVGNLR